jgi:predicted enzyme related to lactoylglutathione lyase
MGNPVVHFEIVGRDAPGLRAFYHDAFGWQMQNTKGAGLSDYALVLPESGSSGISGGIGACPDGYSGHVTFYVQVDDVKRALETIEQCGGTRMMGPEQVPNGPVIGLFKDPEGHVVGVTQVATAT